MASQSTFVATSSWDSVGQMPFSITVGKLPTPHADTTASVEVDASVVGAPVVESVGCVLVGSGPVGAGVGAGPDAGPGDGPVGSGPLHVVQKVPGLTSDISAPS